MENRVAEIILSQLGGARRVAVMTGARFVATANGLNVKLGRRTVAITLDASDTYTVRLYAGHTLRAETSDVYAESLVRTFEEMTGLYLSFGTCGRVAS